MPRSITAKIVECRTPGGLTARMERWYYDNIRNALLRILPQQGVHAELYQLHKRVFEQLDVFTRENIESLSWHVAWVRLDLEYEGLLERDAAYIIRIA